MSARTAFGVGLAVASLAVIVAWSPPAHPEETLGIRSERLERALRSVAVEDQGARAMVWIDAAGVRTAAADADRRRAVGSLGLLDGAIVTVKDNIEVAGAPTAAGARSLAALGPAVGDAPVIGHLRAAGALLLGSTNMDTWARGVRGLSETRGQTANPRLPGRNAGGSSAGAAVSVAAGWADLAIGTDTCGSIRYPAASTGLFGMRPSRGVLSRAGVVPLSPTQDTVGVIARDPVLIGAAIASMAQPDPRDPLAGSTVLAPPSPGSDVRIGVVRSLGPWRRGADGSTVLDALRAQGWRLVDVVLPALPAASVIDDEAIPSRARYLAHRSASASGPAAPAGSADPWLEPLSVADPRGYRARLAARSVVSSRLTALMDRHGLTAIATPTNRADPAPLGSKQASGNCHLAATSGLPSIAVPGPTTADGRPTVGADLLGRAGDDLELVELARRLAT
jgi:Asp-tRNA(Asn)/Glu-tRNA(Gln) amidotransferase A subunit family amidase